MAETGGSFLSPVPDFVTAAVVRLMLSLRAGLVLCAFVELQLIDQGRRFVAEIGGGGE